MNSKAEWEADLQDFTIEQTFHPDDRPFKFSDADLPDNKLQDIAPFTVVARDDWGAREPAFGYKMKHPIKTVRFVYEDLKKYDAYNVTNALRLCQEHHINEKRLYDIPYNFIIAKGGIVFEGRGWNTSPASVDKQGDTLDICFIGDYSAPLNPPSFGMMHTAYSLVNTGVKEELIEQNHKVIGMKVGAQATSEEKMFYADWSKD